MMKISIEVVSHEEAQKERLRQDRISMKLEALANCTARTEDVFDAGHTIERSSKLITNYTYERIKEREREKKREKEEQQRVALEQLKQANKTANNDLEFD